MTAPGSVGGPAQPGLEDQPRGVGVDVLASHAAGACAAAACLAQVRRGGRRGQALVHELHGQSEATREFGGEGAAGRGEERYRCRPYYRAVPPAAGTATSRATQRLDGRPVRRRRAPPPRPPGSPSRSSSGRPPRRCAGRRSRRPSPARRPRARRRSGVARVAAQVQQVHAEQPRRPPASARRPAISNSSRSSAGTVSQAFWAISASSWPASQPA